MIKKTKNRTKQIKVKIINSQKTATKQLIFGKGKIDWIKTKNRKHQKTLVHCKILRGQTKTIK